MIFSLIPLIQIVEEYSSKYLDLDIAWLVGASLISVGMVKSILHLKIMKSQYAGFPFDETAAFRLCSLFIVGGIMMRGVGKTENDKKENAPRLNR